MSLAWGVSAQKAEGILSQEIFSQWHYSVWILDVSWIQMGQLIGLLMKQSLSG